MGKPVRATLVAADADGVEVSFAGGLTRFAWGELSGRRQLGLFGRYRPPGSAAEEKLRQLAVGLGLEWGP